MPTVAVYCHLHSQASQSTKSPINPESSGSERMKTMVNRRRTAPSATTKALSKSRNQSSFNKESPYTSPTNGSFVYPLNNQNSLFIMDDQVQISKGLRSQERHILLFSDKLVIAKSKSSSSLKVKKQVALCEMWIATCVDKVSEKKTSSENSFLIGWPTTNCVITFSTSEAKEKWFSALQWQISEMKRDEYPKKMAINILLFDETDGSSVVTVMANNTDTADTLAEIAAQNLRITGRAADYHLCVISGKEEVTYPLIGHEYPFSIIMNCLRDGSDLLQGSNNNNLSEYSDMTFLMEQLPKDRQCQFILKPRPPPPLQLRQDTTSKHFKRKKSLIDWAFRRSTSVPTPGSVPDSPTTPQKLFGLSLSSVCQNGILPKPIMDMLLLLYHDGPSTKGIFRRSANAKTCKELKEKLNSGNDVQMDGESVFVAAAVITDFLRNIPDSILSSQMYELWMEAMETENTEEKLGTIKRLVQQLPDANFILLRHLFGVLYHIEKNSEENQMTASNLALCIAPNMLWLPSPTGPEQESKSTRKVAMLVQFLIEKSPQIFGADTASLFSRLNEEQQRNVEALLDMDLIQTPDSSDELESAFSYQERRKYHRIRELKPFFGTQNERRVDEQKESWDLFDETCTSFSTKAENNDSADSCENLDYESFYASGSICSFEEAHSTEPSRDRCSSEPSVCLRSRLAAQVHEPVTRQVSYDTALTHSSTDYLLQLKKLQLEGQTLTKEAESPKQYGNKYSVWRSPQINSRMKHVSSQKVSLSNRSSFSSLSSTTTSASSISSLDSAMSYCSDSPVFSPRDVSSLPFMFGTSARLNTMSSENSKYSREWSITTSNTACSDQMSESYDNSEGSSDGVQQQKNLNQMSMSYAKAHSNERGHKQGEDKLSYENDSEEDVRKHASYSETLEKQFIQHSQLDNRGHADEIHGCNNTSMVHVDKGGKEVTPTNKEPIKRTKITFYMTPSKVTMRSQSENKNSGVSVSISRQLNALGENQNKCSVQTSKLHIPQTVFYGQNTPLVLQSAARKCYEGSGSQVDNEMKNTNKSRSSYEKLVDGSGQATSAKSHSRTVSAVKHTVQIVLPTSVRNTVKEYFIQSDAKSCQVNTRAVEKELLRSKMEWHNKRCTETSSGKQDNITFAEESFV
ncbi:rho GTPase-activating protein 20-like isoform X2 [Protopterus annectens]|uniref:rho GTPase-activating protein 20-like isoform X2 n=1 Tax=Protopterus annectens TaxID=7888 RepID=UPI001CF94F22|nr:rho GTPase-activating protein 20-like isoform X2 [Protopterus annectens]